MTQRIDVPGVGIVEFPDSMDDSQITAAIKDKIIPQYSPPKSTMEKFAEPFKDVSIKDWSEKSLLAPMLQTMRAVTPFGMLRPDLAAQDLKSGSQNLMGKGKQMAQGAYQIATNPVESAQKAYTAVTENPAGVAGEMVKGMLYDPEMLIGSGLGNVAESAVKSTVQGAKTLGNVAEGAVNTLGRRGTQPGERATYAGQYESARQPAGNVYHTPENIQAWRAGQIDTAELNNRAMPYTAEQAAALKRTGGMVPYTGQVARATGEALAEPYTRLSGYLPDLASAAIGYGLLGPAGAIAAPALNLARKGVGLYNAGKTAGGMRQLGDLGFEPLYAQETKALQYGRPHPSVIPTPAGPVSPQQLAAGKINPQTATTPAAQAAQATTQAKVQTQSPAVAQTIPEPTAATAPIPEPQVQPVAQPKPTLQEAIAKFKTPAEMRRALYTTVPSDKLEALIKLRFPPETPVVKPAMVETPEGTAVRTADDAMREFLDEQRGIVRGDVATTRQNFIKNIEETKVNLTAAREENKKLYGDRALSMNPNAGKGSLMPNPKDNIDTKAVVRHMIKSTGISEVRQANKKISVNRDGYDAIADQAGVVLDWSTAPKVRDMGLADARKTINTWVYKSIDQQYPELGLTARQESRSVQQRRADKERAAEEAAMTAEQRAQRDADIQASLPDLQARLNRLQGLTGRKPEVVKSTPKTKTPAATPEVSGAVVPEGVTPPAPMTKQELLDLIKNRQKNNKPPGVMEMISNDKSAVDKINAEPWLTPEDFTQEIFMKNLGSKSNKEFIAKGQFEDGKIIRAVDKKMDSEAIQYNDGSAFMTRNYKNTMNSDYSIFNKDGTRYEVQKVGDEIIKVELKDNDKTIAVYEETPFTNKPTWAVNQDLPDGGGMVVYPADAKKIGNEYTRKLHKELPKIDFNSVIAENIARADDLRNGK